MIKLFEFVMTNLFLLMLSSSSLRRDEREYIGIHTQEVDTRKNVVYGEGMSVTTILALYCVVV